MKRLIPVAAVALLFVVAGSTLRGEKHPFWDRSDDGRLLHVLPPPDAVLTHLKPTFANPIVDKTSVFPPSYGSGNLVNHGGPQIATAGFWAIYWNSSVANSNATSTSTAILYTTLKSEINAFISSYPDGMNWDNSATDDYEIIQQYGTGATPIAPTLMNWGAFVDNKAAPSIISDSQLRRYLTSLFSAGTIMPREDTVYGIYMPAGTYVQLQGGYSCISFCGYHGNFSYLGRQIKYAVFPYLNCSACKLAGLKVGDMLSIVSSHEIREAVTDPELNAWYDSQGYEADDKCAWHNLYQMTKGGFWVQPEYSNGTTSPYPGPGCIVPNK
jgi:hypothetical protein